MYLHRDSFVECSLYPKRTRTLFLYTCTRAIIERVFTCPCILPYKIILSVTFTGKKTNKTEEILAASLGTSTQAKTVVDGKAVSAGCRARAGI